MPQTETKANVGSPVTSGTKSKMNFYSGNESTWINNSTYTNSLFISNTQYPEDNSTYVSTFGFRDANGNLTYIRHQLRKDDRASYSDVSINNDEFLVHRTKDGYSYVHVPNALNTLVLHNSVVYNNDSGEPINRPSGIVMFMGGDDITTATRVTYTGAEITPLVIRQGDNERTIGINNSNYNSEQCIPTNAAVTAYVESKLDKTVNTYNDTLTNYTIILGGNFKSIQSSSKYIQDNQITTYTNTYVPTNAAVGAYIGGKTTNMVTADSPLTSNTIILGNGSKTSKTSSKYIQNNQITTYTNSYVPTNAAVGAYINSKINDLLGVSSNVDIDDIAEKVKQIDSIVKDNDASTGILAYIRTNTNNIDSLENRIDEISSELKFENQYLTIESLEDNNTISWKLNSGSNTKTISISTDNGKTWENKTSTLNTNGVTLATLNTGDKLLIKGSNTAYGNTSSYNCFKTADNFKVYGNIMSLIYGDNFVGQTSLTASYTFKYLFYGCSKLIDAENLILPATTLTNYCYDGIFYNCTSLTKAPELPATTLSENCYGMMFYGCTSLTKAPELPATTLLTGCYGGMFYGCTSLTKAPELPATTLTNYCYTGMFRNCTSLTKAPELPATILATSCYEGMFYNCTSLTKAPELPAGILIENCYADMFNGCSNLNFIKMNAFNINASGCLSDWVKNVAPIGTFIKNDTCTSLTINSNSGIPIGWTIFNESEYEVVRHYEISNDYNIYSNQYLTIESLANNNTISWKCANNAAVMMAFSTDNGESWKDVTASNSGEVIYILNEGEKIIFKCDNIFNSSSTYAYFTSTDNFKVYGNIMSLIYNDDFVGKTSLQVTENIHHEFIKLFYNCEYLIDAENLILPATTLTTGCYSYMFQGCISLTNAPKLPATTLIHSCYDNMFNGCSNLIKAPELPATTLAYGCYANMFNGCTSLTEAPELPATTLAINCYSAMFYNCTGLTKVSDLTATIPADGCYAAMFSGCTGLVNAPNIYISAFAGYASCCEEMFLNCTSLVKAPKLPATILETGCYAGMFAGCTSLTEAPELPATTLATGCYAGMFSGCSKLNYIKMMATNINANGCMSGWVYGVAPKGLFIKDISMTTLLTGVDGIPTGWVTSSDESEYEVIRKYEYETLQNRVTQLETYLNSMLNYV